MTTQQSADRALAGYHAALAMREPEPGACPAWRAGYQAGEMARQARLARFWHRHRD